MKELMETLKRLYWRIKKHNHQYNVWYCCKVCGLTRKEIDAQHKH